MSLAALGMTASERHRTGLRTPQEHARLNRVGYEQQMRAFASHRSAPPRLLTPVADQYEAGRHATLVGEMSDALRRLGNA